MMGSMLEMMKCRQFCVGFNGVVVGDFFQLFVLLFSQLILRVLVSLVAVIGRNLILTNCFLEVSSYKLMN